MRARIRTGLECLVEEGPGRARLERGARVGLVSHPASVDRKGRHAIDLLLEAGDLRLVRLFAPEHGVRGEAQDMEPVEDTTDPESGIPVRSLYGAGPESLRPAARDLEDLDAVVYDLQDVGTRYYTFVYTLSHVMEAAGEAGVPVVVLDRPNPLGGAKVEGPVLDPELSSFVGRYPLPVRHGMTTGELATMMTRAFGIDCDLRVVAMAGWRRRMHHEDTGLPWVAPSPNMPTPDTARVYPGGCLVEGTNLSEGRGTTRPFELVGAPWLRGSELVRSLRRERLPGLVFRDCTFRPSFHKHAGEACRGVQVHVTSRRTVRAFSTYLAVIREAMHQDRRAFRWRREAYEFETERPAIDLLLGRGDLRPMLEARAAIRDMEASWRADLAEFTEARGRFTIYDD